MQDRSRFPFHRGRTRSSAAPCSKHLWPCKDQPRPHLLVPGQRALELRARDLCSVLRRRTAGRHSKAETRGPTIGSAICWARPSSRHLQPSRRRIRMPRTPTSGRTASHCKQQRVRLSHLALPAPSLTCPWRHSPIIRAFPASAAMLSVSFCSCAAAGRARQEDRPPHVHRLWTNGDSMQRPAPSATLWKAAGATPTAGPQEIRRPPEPW